MSDKPIEKNEVPSIARRCIQIAEEVSDSYEFPSEHAVGAETVAVSIRREFGLDGYGQLDPPWLCPRCHKANLGTREFCRNCNLDSALLSGGNYFPQAQAAGEAQAILERIENYGFCPSCGCNLANTKGCPWCEIVTAVRSTLAKARVEMGGV